MSSLLVAVPVRVSPCISGLVDARVGKYKKEKRVEVGLFERRTYLLELANVFDHDVM